MATRARGPALKAFTIIELMVAIAIIGILSAIVIASLGSSKAGARDARRISDIRNIQLALSQYYADNNFYPTNIYNTYNSSDGVSPTVDGLKGTYLPTIPTDPTNNTNYPYSAYYPGLSAQICGPLKPPVYYHLGAALETNNAVLDNNGGADAGIPSGTYVVNGVSITNCQGALDFQGESTLCDNSPSTDRCFDVSP
jgi:prepilin-type N-terminal cleavage/methylation domain-containing protein